MRNANLHSKGFPSSRSRVLLTFSQSCQAARELFDPPITRHLEKCRLYCTSCFYSKICTQHGGGALTWASEPYSESSCCSIPCEEYNYDSKNYKPTKKERSLCPHCSAAGDDAVLDIRARRLRIEMQSLWREERCVGCKAKFSGDDRRWWACAYCKRQCMWEGHKRISSLSRASQSGVESSIV